MKEIIREITDTEFEFNMSEIFKGMLRDLRELNKEVRLVDKKGQSNRIWDKSQMLSSIWRVQRGESLRLSLYAWEGRRWWPMRKRLNLIMRGLDRVRSLNQIFLLITGTKDLYLDAKCPGKLFQ